MVGLCLVVTGVSIASGSLHALAAASSAARGEALEPLLCPLLIIQLAIIQNHPPALV